MNWGSRGLTSRLSAPALILACTPAHAGQQTPVVAGPDAAPGDIVVIGQRIPMLDGLRAEDELGRDDIDAYGLDTVGQVLQRVSSEVDTDEGGPVVLINGQRATGINDIDDLPVEAVTKIQILPRGAAARLGQGASRRVINVVIKPDHAQITPNIRSTVASNGGGYQQDTEIGLLKLVGGNRRSLTLKANHVDPLLESQRGIIPDQSDVPYDERGTIVASPLAGGEIDPRLSALAGSTVTIAAVPRGVDQPSLADIARTAGTRNPSDPGRYRTLIGETDGVSANASLSQPLGGTTVLYLNGKAEHAQTRSLRGLSPAVIRLPAGSPFSPFSREVAIAYLLGPVPRAHQDFTAIDLAGVVNAQMGKVAISARLGLVHRIAHSVNDLNPDPAALQSGVMAGTVNPFADPSIVGATGGRVDQARSRADSGDMQLSASGPLFSLPAGAVLLAGTVRAQRDRGETIATSTATVVRPLRRDQIGARGNLTVPLLRLSGATPVALTADVTGHLHKLTSSDTLADWGVVLNGDVGRVLNLTASYLDERIAPPTSALNDLIVAIDNFRVFDFVRQQTVLVRNVTGGNPALPVQRKRTTSIQATVRPFAGLDLAATAEYLRIASRDVFAPLPPVSAAVQAAFPDRFVRDAGGTLTQIDSRPVTFLRDDSDRLRWGFRFRRTFGGVAVGADDGEDRGVTKGRGIRVTLDATHDWVFGATRQARAALPVVDLLRGGAIGYGGGLIRHAVTANLGLASRGVGLQIDGQWRGPSVLTAGTTADPSRLTFMDRTLVNARLFANMGPLLADRRWARSLRLSIQVANLFDSRQRVRDDTGATPLRYQPFLIDPIGRSVTFGVRKAF